MKTNVHTYSHIWVFKTHLCTQDKQVHMHTGRYCYMHSEIKLANAIAFLPGAAEPIWKHQRTCWLFLFEASSHLPNLNSITTRVFIQNTFSFTVANYILIHEAHFIEEIVSLVWDWRELLPHRRQGDTIERWLKLLFVLSCVDGN